MNRGAMVGRARDGSRVWDMLIVGGGATGLGCAIESASRGYRTLLLDGSDSPVTGIDVRHIPVDDFRVGMRLHCVWRPPDERTLDDVSNRWGTIPDTVFERWDPTGEPDVDPELVREHNF